MSGSGSVATVALVVSLIALPVTSAQLIGQIFATAEGHRRCQASVIGDWAKLTKRKWHWTSFRFETIVSTPVIRLSSAVRRDIGTIISPFGLNKQPLPDYENSQDELACWISLLREIEKHTRAHYRLLPRLRLVETLPIVENKSRSWDFMPPEVVRPFASTTAGDMAILALRLGMTWKSFRPEEGLMEAEGNGHVLSATLVRALGILVRYSKVSTYDDLLEGQSPRLLFSSFVETSVADKMRFGYLDFDSIFGSPMYMKIGDPQAVYKLMTEIDPSNTSINNLKSMEPSLYGFNDVIALVSPWLRYKGMTINGVPSVTYDVLGSTIFPAAQSVFYTRLKDHSQSLDGSSKFVKKALQAWDTLDQKFPRLWKESPSREWLFEEHPGHRDVVDFLDAVQDTHEQMSKLLLDFNYISFFEDPFLWNLVKVHITRATSLKTRAQAAVKHATRPDQKSQLSPQWIATSMELYWDDIGYYQDEMQKTYGADAEDVPDAWILLMFRAFLWSRGHEFDTSRQPLPSKYYGSQIPVYIG
ncbi:MAG: hypothetical protein Q9190_002572 [Brigantiaea leucoxantha]